MTATRLDEPDPVAAWRSHIDRLRERAASLDERRFDRLHFTGPGTDLTVGLSEKHRWLTAAEAASTASRTSSTCRRRRSSRRPTGGAPRAPCAHLPLALGGTIVRGLEVRFSAGKVVEVRAETGEDAVREEMATDEGATFLGEVALVDGDSRVRKTGVVFLDTLFDENAACHIAWGQGIPAALDGGEEMTAEQLDAEATTTRSSTPTS